MTLSKKRLSMFAAVAVALVLPLQAARGAYEESVSSTFNWSGAASVNRTPYASNSWEQALPTRLKIPRIKVNAAIQYVGLTDSGAVDVPKGRADVAWYKLGPRPGAVGSAVIVGHAGQKPGPATVFDNLPKLRRGDLLYVQDAKGKSITFVVRAVHTYSPDAIVPEVFTSASGAHLNLVTCEGVWSNAEHGFTERLVVFTDLKK